MPIIVNTNMSALTTQRNLTNATNDLNKALNRMSTGLRVNSSADDAAGMFVASTLDTQIRGSKVAQDNVATGINVLQTVEGDISVIEDNLLRIRDLATQAANGIYSEESMQAMQNEVDARIEEINRIANASNFNGLNLLNGNPAFDNGLRLQVGANSEKATNCVVVPAEIFANAEASSLGLIAKNGAQFQTTEEVFKSASNAALFIADVDKALTSMNTHKATIGAIQNRLESAMTAIDTNITQLTNSRSTMRDADIAEESTNYISAQILQSAAATLLATANQVPSIAVQLI